MARADQIEIRARIVIERPVPGVKHSLQEDDAPLDPKSSKDGEPLAFEFPLRIERMADGRAKFFGKQVRRDGKERRFVDIRIGQPAGQHLSLWSRRMKIDIHDVAPALRGGGQGRRARRHDRRNREGRKPGLRDDPAGDLARALSGKATAASTFREGGPGLGTAAARYGIIECWPSALWSG